MGSKEDPRMMKRGFSQNDAVQVAQQVLKDQFPEKSTIPVAFGYGSLESGDVIVSPIGLKNWDKETKGQLTGMIASLARTYQRIYRTTSFTNQSSEYGVVAALVGTERMWLVAGLTDDENLRCAIEIANAAGDLPEEKMAALLNTINTLFLD